MSRRNFITHILAGTLAATMLTCASPAYAQDFTNAAETYPSIPQMTLEEYPKVDGSLACIPLMEALIQAVTGCDQTTAEESLADFTNTNPSYSALKDGRADLILSYEASAETKEKLENLKDLDLAPVGRDALVFIVNSGNPVDSLTKEQIHDIYTGKIQNWSEVGGDDIEIKAFQRRENSGSQTLMRLLLMGDEEIPEKQMISISTMDGLIDTVMSYDNSANAIGFSVYYYASEMEAREGMKIISVDGIAPSNETIRSGEYTLSNPFYVGIPQTPTPNAQLLHDWLLSNEGQKFVEDCGYVAAG
ncbi:MAG: substrate-binding domain-containing protein [Blautia sp.]|nr:substrate-binding domain-containing protein [Blautia sp.]